MWLFSLASSIGLLANASLDSVCSTYYSIALRTVLSMDIKYSLFPTPTGDWSRDVFALQSIRMAAIYNIIIRSLNSIIYHARGISPADVPAFMKYCRNLATLVRYHAMIEDSIFLFLEMNLPREQGHLIPHAMDLEGLDSWTRLCSSIRGGDAEYHAVRVLSLLKQFADPMIAHMEATMVVALLKKYITAGMLETAPLLMLNADCTHNPWFPPVPGPVILVLRHIVIPLNSNTWKFSQCDTSMRPKDKLQLSEAKSMVTLNVPFHIIGLLALAFSYSLWTLIMEHSATP
ncbi:unnamed protein product [Rhizoctonia solani]|uniref:Hemerythrin-like domain-containing protein n=1 Tax=Rhizoctonia solani TaxID=456999 RepID=A0A8H2XJH9_9AGAM|nr:unnamed protein product [Rhizoctonia solani]